MNTYALNGDQLSEETVTREQALIAHTRNNAWFVFREKDIGSLEAGKFADMAVLDADYLTVPEDDIRNIQSVMTLVGGKVVYEQQVNKTASR